MQIGWACEETKKSSRTPKSVSDPDAFLFVLRTSAPIAAKITSVSSITKMTTTEKNTGPLAGVRVVEFAGIGPGPFAAMLLADMGAEVIVIEQADARMGDKRNPINRGKRSIALNLKKPADQETAWKLLTRSDVLIEGYRPGVMERLGFGPEAVQAKNTKLIYGRMTGWGQTGPMAQMAGHDINYVALSGAMSFAYRPGQAPLVPATLVGDVGGALYLAFGIVCALLEAKNSGQGQVIDAAIIDSAAHMQSLVHAFRAMGIWKDDEKENFFFNSSHFYEVFTCADGKHFAIGAIETPFYVELVIKLDLFDELIAGQYHTQDWAALKALVAKRIAEQPQAHWVKVFEGSDACAVPVLDLPAAAAHPHNRARGLFVEVDGQLQAAPAPRFSRSNTRAPSAGTRLGEHSAEILAELAQAPS